MHRHPLNRRITATTPFQLTGPAAGSELLRTSADPTGTRGARHAQQLLAAAPPRGARRCHGEENFNQYFANAGRSPTEPTARLKRYGIGSGATERKWERFDKRFDLAQEPNEAHRFGWVVELDPYDPDSTPAQAHRARAASSTRPPSPG